MADQSSIEGVIALLHVSALVGALMLAYVKIDKIYEGPDVFEEGLLNISKMAREIVLQNGLNGLPVNRRDIRRVTIIFPACVICLIADQPREIGRIMKVLHFFYRQIHMPMYFYFKNRWHIAVGMVMAVISLVMFFGLAYVLIWEIKPVDVTAVKAGYCLLGTFVFWLVLTNHFSSKLGPPRLKGKCERLMKKIKQRIARREADAWEDLADFDNVIRVKDQE